MYLGTNKLRVVLDSHPGRQDLVVRKDEQRKSLGKSFEHHLMWSVDGEQPDPRNVSGARLGREAGALQSVAEYFMERELTCTRLGELSVPKVEP
jgi:hypothetical protein